MLKPRKNRVLLRVEKPKSSIILPDGEKKEVHSFFVEDFGEDVKGLEVGQEVMLLDTSHLIGHKDFKDYAIAVDDYIIAIIERG